MYIYVYISADPSGVERVGENVCFVGQDPEANNNPGPSANKWSKKKVNFSNFREKKCEIKFYEIAQNFAKIFH